MMRSWAGLAASLAALSVLAACSGGEPPPPTTDPRPAPPPPAPTVSRDQCGSHELAYLVGKKRTEIPVPVDPSLRRVACTTCPVTQDYNPRRANIFFDADTLVIKQVKCG